MVGRRIVPLVRRSFASASVKGIPVPRLQQALVQLWQPMHGFSADMQALYQKEQYCL